MYAIRVGSLTNLSEQDLVDCDILDSGCSGGSFATAFAYVLLGQDGHFSTEAAYPYSGSEGACTFVRAEPFLEAFGTLSEPTEADLLAVVFDSGPMAVAIDASHASFQLYFSGVYDEPACSATEINQGLLCVGYGVDGGVEFWIAKNSWGIGWGEAGFVRMVRNKGNQCGIATEAYVPVIY
jgi:hypothetical protein